MNTFAGFGIDVHETSSAIAERAVYPIPVDGILDDLAVSLNAVAVPHGMMPTVAFRIDCGAGVNRLLGRYIGVNNRAHYTCEELLAARSRLCFA